MSAVHYCVHCGLTFCYLSQMMQYVEHTIPGETLIDSDRESNKSEEGDVAKEQRMFIWNQKFEVCMCVYLTFFLLESILLT